MSGRSSRRRGHAWERTCARWFTDHGFGDVRTGRAVTGGTQTGSDLVTVDGHTVHRDVVGWSIECKDHERSAVTGWLRQAADDTPDGWPYAVIHKTRHKSDAEATVWLHAVWADQLLDLTHPAGTVHVPICLATFTAALASWEHTLDD